MNVGSQCEPVGYTVLGNVSCEQAYPAEIEQQRTCFHRETGDAELTQVDTLDSC